MAEPSWQELYDVFRAAAQNARPTLLFEEGDVTDAMNCGTSSVGTMILARIANRFLACFLDGAVGDDLTALAHDRGVDRDPGAEAIGTVRFFRPTDDFGGGVIPAGFRVATEPDENGNFTTVLTDEEVVFGASDLEKFVTAKCDEIGKVGNVTDSTLIRPLDNLFDPSIVVTNPQRFAGGTEEETDEDLRDRVRGFFLTQARGTVDALVFGARQVPGVERVTVVVDESGVVTVYVADAEGNSNAAMVAAATAELEHWRGASDVIYVSPGVLLEIDVALTLTVRTGVAIGPLMERVRQAVVSRIGRLNPGETLYRDMISAAARDVDRDAIQSVEVLLPATNLAPQQNELLRTALNRISFP